jgi:hypothetical protein
MLTVPIFTAVERNRMVEDKTRDTEASMSATAVVFATMVMAAREAGRDQQSGRSASGYAVALAMMVMAQGRRFCTRRDYAVFVMFCSEKRWRRVE